MGEFLASTASIDITPPLGFPLGGYLFRTGVSQGILDPIRARLLFLSAGSDRLLLVSLDWVFLDGRWTTIIKEAIAREVGIDEDQIIISAVHTHSGPGVFRSSAVPALDEDSYLEGTARRLVEAAQSLTASARPVTLWIGKAGVSGLGAHRNDPERPVDDELIILTAKKGDGKTVSRIVNYGCHPTVLGPENLMFSADWVGRGLAKSDGLLGGTSLLLNGGSADVSTRFTRRGRDQRELGRFTDLFFNSVRDAEDVSRPLVGEEISVGFIPVPVGYRVLPDREQVERRLAEIEGRIKKACSGGLSTGGIRRLESIREGILVTLYFIGGGGFEHIMGPRNMELRVILVKIGTLGIIFLPGEVMSETALALKARASFDLMVCGYAEDYFGYLAVGEDRYESTSAFLSPESIGAVVKVAYDLIEGRQ